MILQPGARLGPYEIVAPLGAGGMGEVYRARDPRLGREVAIKTLPELLAHDVAALKRFEREAKAVAALSHPNILDIFDVGSDQGISYVVTELLHGETLRELLARSPLPWRKAIEIGASIADGLAAAHAQGIVHRDLKPENVFLTSDGRVKLLDFGLARHAPPLAQGELTDAPTVSQFTEPGTVLGTLAYMAPEQVCGTPADHRSDIFAFGTILYEALSGRWPFRRENRAETMAAILNHDPPPLREFVQRVPPQLERLVRRCLEKRPDERFQSARDLAFDLRAAAGEPTWNRSRSRLGRLVIVSTLALVVIAAGVALWLLSGIASRPSGRRGAAAAARAKSIAVLPFENLSPDPENAFFADGITEDILAQLAQIRDLKVIARTSVMRYKATDKPVREIASELGVATVLEGSVRRAANRVRIVSQLIEAETEQHLWAETYDRDLEDVFAIQSEVAQRIAAALQATLSAAEKERIEERPTRSMEAYDLYLKGRERYYQYRKDHNEQAIEDFQKALHLDPQFALAHAGLADAYAQRAIRFNFPTTWLDSSIEAGRRALSLEPRLAEGYKALGLAYMHKGRFRAAVEADQRAVDLKPSFGPAIGNLGFALFNTGRFDEALTWLRRMADIDPSNAVGWAEGLGPLYVALGDDARAEAAFRRATEIQPELSSLRRNRIVFHLNRGRMREALEQARSPVAQASSEPRTWSLAGSVELVAGETARARELLEKALPALQGQRRQGMADGGVETTLAYLHLRVGQRRNAERLLEASLEADRRHLAAGNEHWIVPFDIACVHALRGETDEAFRWIDKAIEAGWRGWPNAKWTPLLDPLRSDERFEQVMSRLDTMIAEMRRKSGL